MLAYVKSAFFFFFTDSYSDRSLERCKHYVSKDECEDTDGNGSDELYRQVTVSEDCACQGSPDATDAVDRESPNWIVDA